MLATGNNKRKDVPFLFLFFMDFFLCRCLCVCWSALLLLLECLCLHHTTPHSALCIFLPIPFQPNCQPLSASTILLLPASSSTPPMLGVFNIPPQASVTVRRIVYIYFSLRPIRLCFLKFVHPSALAVVRPFDDSSLYLCPLYPTACTLFQAMSSNRCAKKKRAKKK